ncbi:MAG: formylmethanofuran dehydrogenase [Clostridiales bacterium]|jgi:formylmethanofuran dehydrogenase subunit E|nr:formylmethanofuran dehydrogenase [Clostridiales bacterium]
MKKEIWEKAVAFHGHECPGLAIGVRACEIAIERLGIGKSEDESIVCVTENDACGVDGVQALLSCTFGKGNLIYRDTGKQAFSFFERNSGQKIRLVLKSFKDEMSRPERQKFILEAPAEDVFTIGEPSFELPEKARIFSTVICESCGEGAPEHKIRLQDGKKVCLDCFVPYSRGW